MTDVRAQMLAELRERTSPTVIGAVSLALGAPTADETGTSWPPVAAYYLALGDQVLVCTIISAGRFLRVEMTAGGDQMVNCVPLSRVARVSETVGVDGTVVALVELDADRRSVMLIGASSEVEGDGAPRGLRLEGTLLPAGFPIEASGTQGQRLRAFAVALRAALAVV